RATTIAESRVAQLQCANTDATPHARILAHGWFSYGETHLRTAFIALSVISLPTGAQKPAGERVPTLDELGAPGGMTPDNYTLPPPAAIDEMYTDADVRESDASAPGVFLFSYGEYLSSSNNLNYAPIIQRAEERTQFHLAFLGEGSMPIIRREWFSTTH